MGAAIWSATIEEMMRFPASSFVRFFVNHGLLQVEDRPQWYTVSGGSREYVRRLTAPLAAKGTIRTGAPAVNLQRRPEGVIIRDAAGHTDRVDQVVLACHADEALALLSDADAQELETLGAFRFQPNRAVLHCDRALMPRRRRAWASWNYMADGARGADARVSVSYWMNSLQNLDPSAPLFVSLNPLHEPDPALTHAAFDYAHPQFDAAAIAAQSAMGDIQGRRGAWYCGAWLGYGFHEDGLSAGLAVAEALGARRPWSVEDMSPAGRNARPRQADTLVAAE
jgi:predicted NAD/FAD-binding protein